MRHEEKASTPQSMALHNNNNNINDKSNNNCTIAKINCTTINCNNDIVNNGLNKEKANKMNTKNTRMIRLYRDGSTQLGFSIRGGWEHGTGIFVSEVHSGSEAAKQGLQAGDQIVRINGFSLDHAIHDEVIALVKSSSKVTLKVKSVGMIPVKDRVSDVLTWKLLSPSSSPSLSSSPSPAWTSSDSHSDSEHDFLEANIFIDLKGKSLGCSVVKGPLNNPGIFVQSVKCGEIADQSGLQVGDQIIQVNCVNVSQMDFSDAISKLKSLPSMTLTVKKGAGKHLFGISNNAKNHFNDNKNISNGDNRVLKKKVTAIVHHQNTHSRMLSSSSNCSESSSGSIEKNCNFSDNDFSISEMEAIDSGSVQNTNHNNNNGFNDSAIKILEKVKQEEERIADERRKLEEEQQKLKLEMEKLEIEKKELERRKQLEECNSLSNCSISSASASSSGSQSISFLEEIKMLGDRGKRNLRPINSSNDRTHNSIINKPNDNFGNNTKPEDKSKLVNHNKCDNTEKHKQHELLMEEFRRAHRRMFGENDNISQNSQKENQIIVKDSLKETKSLPTSITTTKTPPAVPAKKSTKPPPQTGPVVSIGTYNNNSFNNRFVPQNHRSVIQVRREDSKEYKINDNKNNCDKTNPQITIKVISTKQ